MKYVVLGDIGLHTLYHVGDEAMTDVALEMIGSARPEDVTLVAGDPAVATAQYGRPAVTRLGFSRTATRPQLDARLERETSRAKMKAARPGSVAAAVRACDVVLIAGGGNMTSRYAHHLYERVALARMARHFGKRLLVTSQTVGPVLRPEDEALLAELISLATVFGAREDDSVQLCRSIVSAVDGEKIRRTADDAVLLDASAIPTIGEIDGGLPERFIVASFTSDQGTSGLSPDEYTDKIATLVGRLSDELDADVLLVAHTGGIGGDRRGDELANDEIARRAGRDRVRSLSVMTARETAALTAKALLCVGTRYHAAVFGVSAAVPTVAVSLSHYSSVRLRGAMAAVGLEPFIVPVSAWDAVLPASLTAVRRWGEIGPAVRAHVEAQQDGQRAWWRQLTALAEGKAGTGIPREPFARAAPVVIDEPWARAVADEFVRFDAEARERTRSEWLERDVRMLQRRVRILERRLQDGTVHAEEVAAQNQDLRDRLASLKARRSVRLADRAARTRRTLARRAVAAGRYAREQVAARRTRDARASRPAPVISVIVPVYNVEEYVQACLSSILDQSFTAFEVIVVDDGSTDASGQIVRRIADDDRRVRVIRTANRGLGAARNTGASQARGRFLTFVDSDDLVPPEAFELFERALQTPEVDVVVGAHARFRDGEADRVAPWVRDLHRERRVTTLAEDPQLLRNFYTWNKAYRTDFWRREDFVFREGVLFEDQPVITDVLCAARRIAVLDEVTYRWRIRGDETSLTAGMYEQAAVEERDRALQLTAEALRRRGAGPAVREGWRWSLAEHHFPNYLASTAGRADTGSYDAVMHMVRSVLSPEDVLQIDGLSASSRVLLFLAMHGERGDVARFVDRGGRRPQDASLRREDGRLLVALPFFGDDDLGVPREAFVVSLEEQRLRATARTVRWADEADVLTVITRAKISMAPPGQVEVTAYLVGEDGRRLECSSTFTSRDTREAGHAAPVDVEVRIDLSGRASIAQGRRYLELEMTQGGVTRRAPVSGIGARASTTAVPGPRVVNDRLVTVSRTLLHGVVVTVGES